MDAKLGKSGTFSDQISVHLARWAKFTEIWSEKVPDLPSLASNLTHFGAKPSIPGSLTPTVLDCLALTPPRLTFTPTPVWPATSTCSSLPHGYCSYILINSNFCTAESCITRNGNIFYQRYFCVFFWEPTYKRVGVLTFLLHYLCQWECWSAIQK